MIDPRKKHRGLCASEASWEWIMKFCKKHKKTQKETVYFLIAFYVQTKKNDKKRRHI